ncbi:MAG: cytochrome c [Gammaproteobacteria bacterium]|nr:cytochrome c [Gammaproteobacteria bacterium]MCP4088310.1 cytochrome c [Gammaproteobacteria bacterium]MCP4276379.1 cytochrome c [Gammaproteobacteria bacterium]MCP4831026.1 cytochrome c [Gammaproteobacteria bacterium]MCP4927453.1 cytochrome c [Gammaproteobacteria bacterium]
MNKVIQITGLSLIFLLLMACEQPLPESDTVVDIKQLTESNSNQQASIDAEGNIAPFGFASKQPVALGELVIAEPVTEATATLALYNVNCAGCHGGDAAGVQGLGLNLLDSELIAGSSQTDLVAFLKVGRLPDSPDSVTGVPMPSFAWMSDADIAEISAYLKGLQN